MVVDPLAIIGAISAMGGLLLFILRQFNAGELLSRHVVRREDYDRVLAINEGYATKFGEQTDAIRALASTVERMVDSSTPPST